MLIVDAHLDLAFNAVHRGRDVTRPAVEQPVVENNEIATVGLPDLRRGNVALICATIFCEPSINGGPGYTSPDEAQVQAWNQMQWYQQRLLDGTMDFITSRDEITGIAARGEGQGASDQSNAAATTEAILLLEGADAFRSLDDVKMWFDLGLRIVALAWKRTRFAGGTGAPGPLTPEGVRLVRELDRFGIIHDASHLAEQSFWQLIEQSAGPVIASHSNCRAIVPGDRHLSDDMIRAIAQRGGVIGMNFYDKFLLPPDQHGKRRAALADVVNHIKHICDLTGSANHVGIGTDMDGGLGREQIPHEITTAADLSRLADALSGAGFADADVTKVMSGNWLGFFERALPDLPA